MIDTIRYKQLVARHNRGTLQNAQMIINVLTTLIGEADTIAKNTGVKKISDTDLQNLVKKFVKNLDVTIEHTTGSAKDYAILEKEYLLQFLPVPMSQEELSATLDIIMQGGSNSMGGIMQALKNSEKSYDAKQASELIKNKMQNARRLEN